MRDIVADEVEKESYTSITKSHTRILTIITIFVGCVMGLLATEYAIRIFAPQALLSDVIAPDPDVDYRLRPGAVGHMSSQE